MNCHTETRVTFVILKTDFNDTHASGPSSQSKVQYYHSYNFSLRKKLL